MQLMSNKKISYVLTVINKIYLRKNAYLRYRQVTKFTKDFQPMISCYCLLSAFLFSNSRITASARGIAIFKQIFLISAIIQLVFLAHKVYTWTIRIMKFSGAYI